MIIDFKSTPANYEKECDGRKTNTIREIDIFDERFVNLALMHKNNDYGKIRIKNTKTCEAFIRKITDITLWKGCLLISWRNH